MAKKSRRDRQSQEDDFSFFEIDEHNLDREWVKQPSLYFTWARKLADARQDLDEAKAKVDVTKAEVSRAIRDDPEDHGLEKVTEAAVTAAIPEHPDMIRAVKELSKARHKVDVYQAAVNALDHRKRALEKLVDLHGQNYFSTPRAPDAESAEALEEAGKQHARRRGRRRDRDDD